MGVRSEDTFLIPSLIARARSALVVGEMLYFYRQRAGSTMHTRGDTMVDERMAAHEEIVRVAREQYPEALEKAKAVTYFIHIRCMNSILDCPNFREHPCWERHIAKFRANLGDLLKTRSRKWLPLRRKAYAILLCACPELAMVYERVRFYKRRRHLVYKEFKKEAQSE